MASVWWQDEDPSDTRTATFPEIAIPPDTFADALAGKDAALHYALYAPVPPRLEDLIAAAAEHGHDQALAALNAYTADPLHRFAQSYEDRLNNLASRLAQTGKTHAAVTVVQINADTHPTSWQTFDYLGEGYQLLHDNTHAIAAYRRSLELTPPTLTRTKRSNNCSAAARNRGYIRSSSTRRTISSCDRAPSNTARFTESK